MQAAVDAAYGAGAFTVSSVNVGTATSAIISIASSKVTQAALFYTTNLVSVTAVTTVGTTASGSTQQNVFRQQTLTRSTGYTACTVSYNGGAAVAVSTAALNALGLGSFTVTGTGPYTVAYNGPAISSLSSFACTEGAGVIATTVEELRVNDGGNVFDTVDVITKRPLPETRYAAGTSSAFYGTVAAGATADSGTGLMRVPIGYGVYIAIPSSYYNVGWGGNGVPFSVQINFDIATASAAVTQVANAAHEDYECSGRGHCDVTTGTCACFEGYYGDHCGMQTILV